MSTHGEAKVVRALHADESDIGADGARGLSERTLLALQEGQGYFDVRFIRLDPHGVSSAHAHPWEQANYILSGGGSVTMDEAAYPFETGDFVYIPPNVSHQFLNEGDVELTMLTMRSAGPDDRPASPAT